jgi:hypothetical protein
MVAADLDRNPEISLTDFLARRARRASDARLIIDAVIGFAVAVAALLAQGPVWYLFTSAGICFLSFGAWGIADRELGERDGRSPLVRLLSVARTLSAIVGFIAAAALLIGALGVAIGRVIS